MRYFIFGITTQIGFGMYFQNPEDALIVGSFIVLLLALKRAVTLFGAAKANVNEKLSSEQTSLFPKTAWTVAQPIPSDSIDCYQPPSWAAEELAFTDRPE